MEEVRSMKVRYRRQAQLDIDHIHEYIEKRNPRAATEVVAAIRRAIVARMGHIGRAPETYEWVVVGLPYIIVYEIVEAADEVAIIAVFHGAQDRDDSQ